MILNLKFNLCDRIINGRGYKQNYHLFIEPSPKNWSLYKHKVQSILFVVLELLIKENRSQKKKMMKKDMRIISSYSR